MTKPQPTASDAGLMVVRLLLMVVVGFLVRRGYVHASVGSTVSALPDTALASIVAAATTWWSWRAKKEIACRAMKPIKTLKPKAKKLK